MSRVLVEDGVVVAIFLVRKMKVVGQGSSISRFGHGLVLWFSKCFVAYCMVRFRWCAEAWRAERCFMKKGKGKQVPSLAEIHNGRANNGMQFGFVVQSL